MIPRKWVSVVWDDTALSENPRKQQENRSNRLSPFSLVNASSWGICRIFRHTHIIKWVNYYNSLTSIVRPWMGMISRLKTMISSEIVTIYPDMISVENEVWKILKISTMGSRDPWPYPSHLPTLVVLMLWLRYCGSKMVEIVFLQKRVITHENRFLSKETRKSMEIQFSTAVFVPTMVDNARLRGLWRVFARFSALQ